jgi:hypothetical protein
MKMSDLREGFVGRLLDTQDRRKFIVTSRCPEDRSSGLTNVTYEDGGREQYVWNYENPEVILIGRGRLVTNIVMEKD